MTGGPGLRAFAEPRFRSVVLWTVLLIVLAFRAMQLNVLAGDRMWGADFAYYWEASSHVLHGEPIYSPSQLAGPYVPEDQEGSLYPPFFAVVLAPLAAAFPDDARSAASAWVVAQLVALVVAVLAVAAAEGLDRRPGIPAPRRLFLLGLALAFTPVVAELSVGNVHLVILALLALGWLGIRRGGAGGDALAGAALAAAALIKVFPILLGVWLLATRRWRAAAWMAGSMAVLAAATIPFVGLQPWLDFPRVLLNMQAIRDVFDSVSPTLWLSPVLGFDLAHWLVIGLGLVAVVLVGLRRQDRIGFAVTVAVSVLVAPAVFHHYLSIMLLPMILAAVAGVSWPVVGLAYLLMWGGQQPALGDAAWILSRVPQTLGWLLLLGALLVPRRGRVVAPAHSVEAAVA